MLAYTSWNSKTDGHAYSCSHDTKSLLSADWYRLQQFHDFSLSVTSCQECKISLPWNRKRAENETEIRSTHIFWQFYKHNHSRLWPLAGSAGSAGCGVTLNRAVSTCSLIIKRRFIRRRNMSVGITRAPVTHVEQCWVRALFDMCHI